MPKRIGPIGLFVVVGLVAAACSGTAVSSPSGEAGSGSPMAESPSGSAAASGEASPTGAVGGVTGSPAASASGAVSPSGAAGASGSPAASASAGAASSPMTEEDLQATIPTVVVRKTVTVAAATPADLPFFSGDDGAGRLAMLLLQVGARPDAVVVATGSTEDDSVMIAALHVAGIDADRLLLAMVTFAHATDAAVTTSREEIGGKRVVKSTATVDNAPETSYFYATNSTVYVVRTEDAAAAEDALSNLP